MNTVLESARLNKCCHLPLCPLPIVFSPFFTSEKKKDKFTKTIFGHHFITNPVNTLVLQHRLFHFFLQNKHPGANVIELFTEVIYHHSMVIQSFCVIKLYYPENYHGIAVNYHGILTL